MQTTLNAEFKIGQVDESELEELLLAHFHSASAVSDGIEFGRTGESFSVKCLYDSKCRLKSVLPGASLRLETVKRIQEEIQSVLLADAVTKIGREICFSDFRVDGYFSIKDRLQLSPIPNDAPQSHFGSHPFVLEFPYRSSDNLMWGARRREKPARENILLLNVFLEGRVLRIRNQFSPVWVTDHSQKPPFCRQLPKSYHLEGFRSFGTEFSDTKSWQPIRQIDPQAYYSKPWKLASLELEAPANLRTLFEIFDLLPKESKHNFLRAAFWFSHAGIVQLESKSASFVAIISAIESLMGKSKGSLRCSACKKEMIGPTQRFKEFLDRFAPVIPETDETREQLYSLRSKLVHGGGVFVNDDEPFRMVGFRVAYEHQSIHCAFQLARIALINWLLSQMTH